MTDLTTTGTFDYAPSIGECVLNGLSRIRIRGAMVKAEHMHMALMEANLMQAEWSNRGPNLWTVDSFVIPTEIGIATYPIPPETVMVLNVTLGLGVPPWEQELTITSVSRQEYTMYPNKGKVARPTTYWFDRLLAPQITLWPVPEQIYNLHITRFRQIQDAGLRNAGNYEIPYLWLDAACSGMSHRLARHYAQDLEMQRKGDYDEAYKIASTQNVEDAPLYIVPMVWSYFR
jgi:hypothetical protein